MEIMDKLRKQRALKPSLHKLESKGTFNYKSKQLFLDQ